MRVVSWFSGGITSTIATMIALEKYGRDNVEIIFFETGAHHPDNERFFLEVEQRFFKKKIQVRRNKKYDDLWHVLRKERFINGPGGAKCTQKLKKEVRQILEKVIDYDVQIFGFEFEKREINRAIRFIEQYPEAKPEFPLIDEKLTKKNCIEIFQQHGIALPAMYLLGYSNNNCVPCVKGGAGYHNKIRRDFPELFEKMAKVEREIKASCLKEKDKKTGRTKKLFLDELDPSRGRMEKPIVESCGAFCGVEFDEIDSPQLQMILNGNKTLKEVTND